MNTAASIEFIAAYLQKYDFVFIENRERRYCVKGKALQMPQLATKIQAGLSLSEMISMKKALLPQSIGTCQLI